MKRDIYVNSGSLPDDDDLLRVKLAFRAAVPDFDSLGDELRLPNRCSNKKRASKTSALELPAETWNQMRADCIIYRELGVALLNLTASYPVSYCVIYNVARGQHWSCRSGSFLTKSFT